MGDVAVEVTSQRTAAHAAYGMRDGAEVRGVDDILREAVRKALKDADDLVGEIIGRVGGNVTRLLRTTFGDEFAGFFGDIFAYLYNRDAVYQRVRDVIDEHAEGYGKPDRPIGAVAHSLGGVILFDLAVANHSPIYLDGFVTFGSQAPFFHAICDRSDRVDKFTGTPVTLPDSIKGAWVNLWEPLDLLAFVARRVFKLADGSLPEDREVPHETSVGWWTHSSYWKARALPDAIEDVFFTT